jgi:cell division protein FtsI (penicillin-binding protein 3)
LVQLAQAYTIFANGGRFVPATLLKQQDKNPGFQALSAQTAAAVGRMLHLATLENGTGVKAQTAGYKVAGKTGTVHKLGPDGYKTNRYRASFVGFAPVDAPRVVVAVVVDDPKGERYYGGDVAAPVFSQAVAQTLRVMGVKPDKTVRRNATAKAHLESL